MITECGLENACTDTRYPEVKPSDHNPDFVFLSSEPYEFNESHIDEF